MGYKTFVSMNIAIVGKGMYCEALAKGLAKAGHNIFIATKTDNDPISEELLTKYKNICPASVEYAGAVSDVIIIATPSEEVREMAYLLDDVRKKVIIDLTSLNLTRYGVYLNTANAIKAITGSADVVKCYNRTGYENLGENEDMIIAGNSKKGKALIKVLATDLKFNSCYDFGEDDAIPALDQMSIEWHHNCVSNKSNNTILSRIIRK